jgi:hypothetical protein
MQRGRIDLSDNRGRAAALDRLVGAAADHDAAEEERSAPMWTVPGEGGAHPSPSLLVGSVWQQLNSLRVMAQYTRILSEMCEASPFLHGHPTTCVHGLQWFSRLAGPLAGPSAPARRTLEKTLDMFRSGRGGGMSREQAAFEVHRCLVCNDRGMTQTLLALHFPDSREYEVDVCAHMLTRPGLTYQQWLRDFPAWRAGGLYHPLVLAARSMPALDQWLPAEAHGSTLGLALTACLLLLPRTAMQTQGGVVVSALQGLADAWNRDESPARYHLTGLLDRLAVLMGVKSNGRRIDPDDFRLLPALASFPAFFTGDGAGADMHDNNFRAWRALRNAVEDTFPPSLLCGPLVRPRRATWGYSRLSLDLSVAPLALRFAQRSLDVVGPAAEPQPQPQTPAGSRECLAQQTSARLQDVLWRLGEIVTSPEIALCMLYPRAAAASLEGVTDPALGTYSDFVRERPLVLSQLDLPCVSGARLGAGPSANEHAAAAADVDPHYAAYTRRLEGIMPPVGSVRYDPPRRLLLWRLDTPARAILYAGAGDDVQPASESQHRLLKVLINSKVPHRTVGGIRQAPPGAGEECVRRALRAFAAAGLPDHPANTVLARLSYAAADDAAQGDADPTATPTLAAQAIPLTCTTLAESVACFALRPAAKVTACPIGQSVAWTAAEGIDPRYAERQEAANGLRFRDWVAMHVGAGGTQQSRLAAHVVEFDALHTTKIPWLSEAGLRWVRVAATAPPHNRTVHGATLRQAVESRFLHDVRMLPTRDPDQAVARNNAELYTDGHTRVAIAYAPAPGDRLELIAFEYDEAAEAI